MDLSQAQVDTYHREGFIVIERAFSPSEMAVLEAALPEITDPSRNRVGFDPASGAVRLSHGAHLHNEAVHRLSLHPRLVRPAQQLLGTEIHVYQSRLTIKAGLDTAQSSGWVWHQDFFIWHTSDGMPEPRALVTFVFLDDVTAANGPLLVFPRSHHRGLIETTQDTPQDEHDKTGSEYRRITIKPQILREMGKQDGVTALTGPAGTLAFMHCSLVHGSAENISPLRRALLSVSFNAVNNPARHPRNEQHCAGDTLPIRPLAEDCLLTMAS